MQTRGDAADLRESSRSDPHIVVSDDYSHPQAIRRSLRANGAQGILYPSVHHAGGEYLAALRTGIVKNCLHAAYLEYH